MNRVFTMHSSRRQEVIQSWLDLVIRNGEPNHYNDLHVDQIDPAWKSPSTWIASALESFAIALNVRDSYPGDSHLSIILAFALESYVRPLGVTVHSREDLEESFSSTPPSLCVYRPGGEFWALVNESKKAAVAHDVVIKPLSAEELFGDMQRSAECVYLEHRRPNDAEYSRIVFLAG